MGVTKLMLAVAGGTIPVKNQQLSSVLSVGEECWEAGRLSGLGAQPRALRTSHAFRAPLRMQLEHSQYLQPRDNTRGPPPPGTPQQLQHLQLLHPGSKYT